MNLDQRIGENVKTVRNRLGLSQAEFASLLNKRSVSGGRKWHQKTISALENASLEHGTWRDLWDLTTATGLAEAWWVSHEVDLAGLNGDKPLYLNTHPSWHDRDDYISLPNESFWTEGHPAEPQRERLPLAAFAR